jgi:hypothetical protein
MADAREYAKGPIQKGHCKHCGAACILFESKTLGGWYTGHEQPMCEAFRGSLKRRRACFVPGGWPNAPN